VSDEDRLAARGRAAGPTELFVRFLDGPNRRSQTLVLGPVHSVAWESGALVVVRDGVEYDVASTSHDYAIVRVRRAVIGRSGKDMMRSSLSVDSIPPQRGERVLSLTNRVRRRPPHALLMGTAAAAFTAGREVRAARWPGIVDCRAAGRVVPDGDIRARRSPLSNYMEVGE